MPVKEEKAMGSKPLRAIAITSIMAVALVSYGHAQASCTYELTSSDVVTATALVTVFGEELEIQVAGARPNTLYTVWVDFRNRASLELSPDYAALLPKGALPRGVAPAFASTAPVTAGMGLDENGFITDVFGDADFEVDDLDYELLRPGDSPVVGAQLAMQGKNRVGGGWLRVYPLDPTVAASPQVIDPATGLPMLERATAQGITIVGHFDFITHGHTPGVGGVDHFGAFKGDFPDDCLP